jgi:hypothetical protein
MKPRFLLGSGYFHPNPNADTFVELWGKTLERYADPFPAKVVILAVGDSWRAVHEDHVPFAEVLNLPGNLMHVHALIERKKSHAFCGWSAAFLTLAMVAYNAELDFVFLEQDCLAVGPWVERMYGDLGDGDMVFGDRMKTAPFMACAQALVLVRHAFIPEMVAAYLSLGTDAQVSNLPETKFGKLAARYGKRIRRLSFGCDRERPIPMEKDVFYCQKLSPHEVAQLREFGKVA